jgi:hypothetical protein
MLQNSLHVALTMQHGHDQQWVRLSSIDDKVGVNRPEKDILLREIFTLMTHSWHGYKLTECSMEILKNAIGSLATVFCNEFPDVLKVGRASGVRTNRFT